MTMNEQSRTVPHKKVVPSKVTSFVGCSTNVASTQYDYEEVEHKKQLLRPADSHPDGGRSANTLATTKGSS